MKEKYCFVAVRFPEDENVRDNVYWYLSAAEDLAEGEAVSAPLGRHNRRQCGIVQKVMFASAEEAPYPMYAIKKIDGRITQNKEV